MSDSEISMEQIRSLFGFKNALNIRSESFVNLKKLVLVFHDIQKLLHAREVVEQVKAELGWEIEIFTAEQYEFRTTNCRTSFVELEGVDAALAHRLVESGYRSFSDLSTIQPDELQKMGDLDQVQVQQIIQQAGSKSSPPRD